MRVFNILILILIVLSNSVYAGEVNELIEDALKKMPKTLKNIPVEIKKVAIYKIENDKPGLINTDNLQSQIEEILLDSQRFYVTSRSALDAILQEQQLSLTGVVNDAEMVKTGKIVGVQGFFFGSVELTGGKFILTLKLIDVETSAIVYSKKFIGESFTGSRFGFGLGYLKLPNYNAYLTIKGDITYTDSATSINNQSPMYIFIVYKQGFRALKGLQFGVEIGFIPLDYASPGEIEGSNPDPPHSGNYYAGVKRSWGINLEARIYLSTKGAFKWKKDILNPYIGVQVIMESIKVEFKGHKNDWTWESTGDDPQTRVGIFVLPVVGIDLNFTQVLTAYIEASFLFKNKYMVGNNNFVAGKTYDSEYIFLKGVALNVGIKFFFSPKKKFSKQ